MNDDDQIPQEYQHLPKDVYDALMSPDTGDKIYAITQKNKLHIDQLSNLAIVVNLVLVGDLLSSEFVPRIIHDLQVSDTQAGQIAADVNEQIFKPVQESLRAMQAKEGKAAVEEVHLSREELLHQLENPQPLPLSGRREAVADGAWSLERGARENTGEPRFVVNTAGIVTDTDAAVAEELEAKRGAWSVEHGGDTEGTKIPINKPTMPQTIFEKKLGNPTVTDKNSPPIDPYREPTT